MEKNSEGKSSILTIIIVAVITAIISIAGTTMVLKKSGNVKSNNVTGTWYNTYAGQTFML